jgi:Zn-dependent protease with chaperone function
MLLPVIIVGMLIFVPMLIIAMAVLRSASRAFMLAGTFTIGGLAGFAAGLLAGNPIFRPHSEDLPQSMYLFVFAGLAGVAGGLIAVWLLGKISGQSLWRRE